MHATTPAVIFTTAIPVVPMLATATAFLSIPVPVIKTGKCHFSAAFFYFLATLDHVYLNWPKLFYFVLKRRFFGENKFGGGIKPLISFFPKYCKEVKTWRIMFTVFTINDYFNFTICPLDIYDEY
jgi:hypothetical protein